MSQVLSLRLGGGGGEGGGAHLVIGGSELYHSAGPLAMAHSLCLCVSLSRAPLGMEWHEGGGLQAWFLTFFFSGDFQSRTLVLPESITCSLMCDFYVWISQL